MEHMEEEMLALLSLETYLLSHPTLNFQER
jgi:hypothetical protein